MHFKLILFSFISFFFIGCSNETSIDEQKQLCILEGKKFSVNKILNLRNGEYELKGSCE